MLLRTGAVVLVGLLSCSVLERHNGTKSKPRKEAPAEMDPRVKAEIEDLKQRIKDDTVSASVRATAVTRIVQLAGRDPPQLSLLDLAGANLSGATLTGAILTYTNFEGANLTKAKLDYTNVGGSNFTKADMRGAILSYSTVTNADFKNTDLREASFNYATVTKADFSGANLVGATYNERTRFDDTFSPKEHGMVDVGLIGR